MAKRKEVKAGMLVVSSGRYPGLDYYTERPLKCLKVYPEGCVKVEGLKSTYEMDAFIPYVPHEGEEKA